MNRLITFTDENMTISAERCAKSASMHNVKETVIYTVANLPKTMVKPGVRGAGCYWLFKPYIIDKELKGMHNGDFLIYADAGVELVNNINYITERVDQTDVFLFGNMYNHFDYCKTAVLDAMLPDWKQFASPLQVQASVIVLRVSDKSRAFVAEWLKWCKKPGMIDDSGESTHTGFIDHRHDQAILTNLAMTTGIDLHWWPAMYNGGQFVYPKNDYPDKYPVLFHHHRLRNDEYKK